MPLVHTWILVIQIYECIYTCYISVFLATNCLSKTKPTVHNLTKKARLQTRYFRHTAEQMWCPKWQDFLVQYLERVQYSGFKPCAVSRVTRYKIYAIMSFLCCTYYPNRAVCTPLHGLQLTHCSIGSASLEFGFSISNQQGALVSLKPLAGYAAGVHYLLCE